MWVWPWQLPLCRGSEVETCIDITKAIAIEDGLVEEPDCPWVDPPPLDIDVCSACYGKREVQARQDWETGAIEMEPCGRCDGSGKEPTWLRV